MADSAVSYTVDWSGQGYEQLAQQMRQFLSLKKQVDAEIRRGFARWPQTAAGGVARPRAAAGARGQAQEEQSYARAERQARQADRQAEREANAYERRQRQQQDRQDRQAARAADQTPRVFAGMSGAGLTTDKEWDEYHKAIGERYKTALRNNEELNSADRRILSSSRQLAALGEKEAKGGLLGRVINTIGWAPFVPQEAYMGSMALGEMGLGLGPAGVAAGLGLGGVAALGLGVYNTGASQLLMARLLAGISAGGSGTVATPADLALASDVATTGRGFGLSAADTYKLLPTAARYNLGRPGTIAAVVAGGLNRAAEGQLTNEQGVQLQALVTSRNGGDAAATAREFLRLNAAIKQVGADTHTVYSDILAEGQALRAGTDLAGFAFLDKALQGTGLTATDIVGGGTTSTGTQRLVQAGMLGMSESSFTALQANPQAFAQRLQRYTRGLMQSTGSRSATEAILQSGGFIAGGDNADEVLKQILQGNFQGTLPKVAGPPAPNNVLDQAVQAETVDNMTVTQLSIPLMSRVGGGASGILAGITDLANGRTGTQAVQGLKADVGKVGGALAGAAPALALGPLGVAPAILQHVITIVVQDIAGKIMGTSTQTATTTPGAGPTPNTTITAPAIPNRTNANGR